MMKEFRKLREELAHRSEREAMKLWRLARRAQAKGCSAKLVQAIGEEANWCYSTGTAYPERLLDDMLEYKMKYAFR